MTLAKPLVRTYREIKDRQHNGYSGWAYIIDRGYAKNAEHYVRALLLIQEDLRSLFEYVEPSSEGRSAYSYRIHALLMRTCIEIEANFKAILHENIFSPGSRNLNIRDYRRIDVTHHLSSYEAILPIWNGEPPVFMPFAPWKTYRGVAIDDNFKIPLPWYEAYNGSKHDRHLKFKEANLENLVAAVSALLILVTAQFGDQDFGAGSQSLTIRGRDYHPLEAATGSLFRIKYPDDWSTDELYDFDWQELEKIDDRFDRIDFDKISVSTKP